MALASFTSWGSPRQLQYYSVPFPRLGSTHALLGSSKVLGSRFWQHTQLAFWALAGSTPLLLLFLLVISWYWYLQNAGIFCPEFTNILSWTFLEDSSPAMQCQASAASHDPITPEKPAPPK